MEHADVDDVVVVHLLHSHAIGCVGGTHDAIAGGVDGDVPMVALSAVHHYGVEVDNLSGADNLWRLLYKLRLFLVALVTLHQLHLVAARIAELEVVRRLHRDAIGAGTQLNGVANDAEIGGLAGGVGKIDGVALSLEERLVGLAVEPHALQQGLGLTVLLRLVLYRRVAFLLFLSTGKKEQKEQKKEGFNVLFTYQCSDIRSYSLPVPRCRRCCVRR